MGKVYRHLYPQVHEWENLVRAWRKAIIDFLAGLRLTLHEARCHPTRPWPPQLAADGAAGAPPGRCRVGGDAEPDRPLTLPMCRPQAVGAWGRHAVGLNPAAGP